MFQWNPKEKFLRSSFWTFGAIFIVATLMAVWTAENAQKKENFSRITCHFVWTSNNILQSSSAHYTQYVVGWLRLSLCRVPATDICAVSCADTTKPNKWMEIVFECNRHEIHFRLRLRRKMTKKERTHIRRQPRETDRLLWALSWALSRWPSQLSINSMTQMVFGRPNCQTCV